MSGGYDPLRRDAGAQAPRSNMAGLGYLQTFVLIFGFILASGLIFLFGIWVGRDVAERRLAQEERIVRAPIPVQPNPPEQAKPGEVDLTFYQQLKEKAERRLQETAAAVSPAPLGAAATPTRPAVQAAAQKSPARSTPAVAMRTPEAIGHTEEWADAGWTVQVNATTNPQQAMDLAHTLRAKGYDAYTVQAPMRGQTWYRVRVGRFPTREQAKDLEGRLKDDGMDNAYITPQ